MISVDWTTRIITVPQAYLTPTADPNQFQLDVDQFRLDLKALEASEAGIAHVDAHVHNTAIVISGVVYARSVQIINDYRLTFEDGQYVVVALNANHNIADVKNPNQVSLVTNNSAGLTQVYSLSQLDSTIDPDGRLKRKIVLRRTAADGDLWVEPDTP